MSDTFNESASREAIIQELYDRLRVVRRAIEMKIPVNDDFDVGIKCRLANEEVWLENLISKVEWS
jgi:hypothetical protein